VAPSLVTFIRDYILEAEGIMKNMLVDRVKCTNGEKVSFEETPYYFKLTVGNKTWYWDRDTGKYDGVSYQ